MPEPKAGPPDVRRVVVIGPLPPWRGGIAQYNSQLVTALRRRVSQVDAYSFKRQYPKWLYPGRSDRVQDQGDDHELEAQFTIDSLDPRTWRRTGTLIVGSDPDLVVIHWWTVFWALCFGSLIRQLRASGCRVAMVCHNVTDHGGGRMAALISRGVQSLADAYLVHSSRDKEVLVARTSSKPVAAHPIPAYTLYPQAQGDLMKRGRLELLYFGFIRPYKGLDVLLDAMALIDDPDVYLTIVGEPWGNASKYNEAASKSSRIEAHLEYVPPSRVAEFF